VSEKDILPSSVPRRTVAGPAGPWGASIRIYCANCGAEGAIIPDVPEAKRFAFWLCNACEPKHGQVAGLMFVPDEVFFEQFRDEMLAKYGHELSNVELTEVLKDDNNILTKLVKDRKE